MPSKVRGLQSADEYSAALENAPRGLTNLAQVSTELAMLSSAGDRSLMSSRDRQSSKDMTNKLTANESRADQQSLRE